MGEVSLVAEELKFRFLGAPEAGDAEATTRDTLDRRWWSCAPVVVRTGAARGRGGEHHVLVEVSLVEAKLWAGAPGPREVVGSLLAIRTIPTS